VFQIRSFINTGLLIALVMPSLKTKRIGKEFVHPVGPPLEACCDDDAQPAAEFTGEGEEPVRKRNKRKGVKHGTAAGIVMAKVMTIDDKAIIMTHPAQRRGPWKAA
jgi:hypothetical protein